MRYEFYSCFEHETNSSKIWPKLLTFQPKQCRMIIAEHFFTDLPELFQRFVTVDKTLVYGYDIGKEVESSQLKSQDQKKTAKCEKDTYPEGSV